MEEVQPIDFKTLNLRRIQTTEGTDSMFASRYSINYLARLELAIYQTMLEMKMYHEQLVSSMVRPSLSNPVSIHSKLSDP